MRAIDAVSQEEAEYAAGVQTAVRRSLDSMMRNSDRSQYAAANKIGVSDIGSCREYVRRTLIDEPWSDDQADFHAAFVGTAVGDMAERALVRAAPHAVLHGNLSTQVAVVVKLVVRGFEIAVPGHADVILGDAVWDFKTADGLGVVRRSGPTERQWFQVHLYFKALLDEGRVPEDGWCVLVFLDRSGSDPEPVVFARRFDQSVVDAAVEWLDDVIYAVQQDEETSRDMPRSWCEACCPRYTACRVGDTDVEGLLDDPVVKDAVEVYNDAKERAKTAKKDAESAKSALRNISGVVPTDAGPFTLRWTHVNPTDVPGYERAGYDQIDLRPVRPKTARKRKGADGE